MAPAGPVRTALATRRAGRALVRALFSGRDGHRRVDGDCRADGELERRAEHAGGPRTLRARVPVVVSAGGKRIEAHGGRAAPLRHRVFRLDLVREPEIGGHFERVGGAARFRHHGVRDDENDGLVLVPDDGIRRGRDRARRHDRSRGLDADTAGAGFGFGRRCCRGRRTAPARRNRRGGAARRRKKEQYTRIPASIAFSEDHMGVYRTGRAGACQ